MEKRDLIPVVAVGGALALIVYLAGKNKTAADNVTMPYGWGSFQNANNPVNPVPSTPTSHNVTIEPWNGPPWNGDYQNYIRYGGNWEAYQRSLKAVPIASVPSHHIDVRPLNPKPTAVFSFNGAAVKQTVRPVKGKGVI